MLMVNQLAGFGGYAASDGGNDANTKFLCHFDGADTSTTFTDVSATGVAITPSGNAQVDTAQSVFGGASLLLDGTGDFLTMAANAAWNFGTGDITIDWRFRPNSLAALGYMYDFRNLTSDVGLYAYANTDGSLGVSMGADELTAGAGSVVTGTWYHCAIVRASGTSYLFLDGVQKDTDSDATSLNTSANTWTIGVRRQDSASPYNGWVDEFRVSNFARWTGAFTPPAVPYF